MKTLEKVALFLCLLFSGLQFFSKSNAPPKQTGSMEQQEAVNKATAGHVDVNYGRFRFFEHNGEIRPVTVDGIEYFKGQLTSAGVVLAVSKNSVHILSDQGKSTFIYPDYGYRTDIPDEPKTASQPETAGKDKTVTTNAHET